MRFFLRPAADNVSFDIVHSEIKRKYRDISFANRSYQEKIHDYGTVDEYFDNHFKPADISIISSHLNVGHITEMIKNGRQRFFNITGVFFSNSFDANLALNSQISVLDWNERLVIENVILEDKAQIDKQMCAITDNFIQFISKRTSIS